MTLRAEDGKLKRQGDFKLNIPTIGMFGGGTQPAKYFDKNGVEVPFEDTKWAKKGKEANNG